jgi:hypothetical protein
MTFKKGQSGNPAGRRKEDGDLRELVRKHTSKAIERLVYWMNSDEPKASVSAASILLDRGWGKPAQAVEISGQIETITVNVIEKNK